MEGIPILQVSVLYVKARIANHCRCNRAYWYCSEQQAPAMGGLGGVGEVFTPTLEFFHEFFLERDHLSVDPPAIY